MAHSIRTLLDDISQSPDIVSRTKDAVDFMDFRFHVASRAEIMTAIVDRAPQRSFAYVVTPNVDHVIRVRHLRSDLWPAYRGAWMTLCDSRILAWLARRIGLLLPVTPGSDLTAAMFRSLIAAGDRVAILGGDAAAIDQLRRDHGLTDLVHHCPPMGFIDDPVEVARAVDFLVTTHARYSFIAVGSPQQEIIAYQVKKRDHATGIGFCIGASLEFLVGRQHRAPRAVQRLSLEWLFRLLSNPRRLWRRYLIDGPMIFDHYRRWARRVA